MQDKEQAMDASHITDKGGTMDAQASRRFGAKDNSARRPGGEVQAGDAKGGYCGIK